MLIQWLERELLEPGQARQQFYCQLYFAVCG